MGDPVRRARLGAAARALVDANRGAKDKTLAVIADRAAAAADRRARPWFRPVPRGPLSALSAVYGGVAPSRRSWYDRPGARTPVASGHQRRQPVVGGSGKTPVVAASRACCLAGERPAILSRGYGGAPCDAIVVVVSDGGRVLEPVERSGDEPQMLARTLRGVPVRRGRRISRAVAADRPVRRHR